MDETSYCRYAQTSLNNSITTQKQTKFCCWWRPCDTVKSIKPRVDLIFCLKKMCSHEWFLYPSSHAFLHLLHQLSVYKYDDDVLVLKCTVFVHLFVKPWGEAQMYLYILWPTPPFRLHLPQMTKCSLVNFVQSGRNTWASGGRKGNVPFTINLVTFIVVFFDIMSKWHWSLWSLSPVMDNGLHMSLCSYMFTLVQSNSLQIATNVFDSSWLKFSFHSQHSRMADNVGSFWSNIPACRAARPGYPHEKSQEYRE